MVHNGSVTKRPAAINHTKSNTESDYTIIIFIKQSSHYPFERLSGTITIKIPRSISDKR